ncbi:MAG: glycosyltransferase family 4 protein, partial [Chloroflexota bacterium]
MTEVCFISPEYLPLSGGTGSYVYYLSQELMKHNNNIDIVTGYDLSYDVKISKQLKVYFVRVFKAPIVKSFMFAASSFRKLNSIRTTANVDITHANLPLVPDFAVPSNFGRALVATVHSTWRGEANAIRGEPYSRLNANEKFLRSFNWFLSIFERRMLERAKRIIAV